MVDGVATAEQEVELRGQSSMRLPAHATKWIHVAGRGVVRKRARLPTGRGIGRRRHC